MDILSEDHHDKKEGKMAKYDAKEIADDAMDVFKMIDKNDDLPESLEAKITIAAHNMNAVKDYLEHHQNGKVDEVGYAGTMSPPPHSSKEAKKIVGKIRCASKLRDVHEVLKAFGEYEVAATMEEQILDLLKTRRDQVAENTTQLLDNQKKFRKLSIFSN